MTRALCLPLLLCDLLDDAIAERDAAMAALREIHEDHLAFLALAIDKGEPARELRERVNDIDERCRDVLEAAKLGETR